MNIFQESLEKLQTLYSISKKISIIEHAGSARVHRTIILEKILEKILLHDHSILLLLNPVSSRIQEVDTALVASATRNIMESTNLYFHISQRGTTPDTVKFRISMMLHNECFNEIDISKKLGFSEDCDHALINRWYFERSVEEFNDFSEFIRLSPVEQAQVLSGRKPAFQMKSPHILEQHTESAVFNLFSNSVHGLHLGLSNNSINCTPAFNNFFNAERLTILSLQISRIYTSHVVKDYLDLRKRLYSLLDPDDKILIKSYMSSTDLENYIQMLREKYEKSFF